MSDRNVLFPSKLAAEGTRESPGGLGADPAAFTYPQIQLTPLFFPCPRPFTLIHISSPHSPFCFVVSRCEAAQARLRLEILLSQPPRILGLQVYSTTSSLSPSAVTNVCVRILPPSPGCASGLCCPPWSSRLVRPNPSQAFLGQVLKSTWRLAGPLAVTSLGPATPVEVAAARHVLGRFGVDAVMAWGLSELELQDGCVLRTVTAMGSPG